MLSHGSLRLQPTEATLVGSSDDDCFCSETPTPATVGVDIDADADADAYVDADVSIGATVCGVVISELLVTTVLQTPHPQVIVVA